MTKTYRKDGNSKQKVGHIARNILLKNMEENQTSRIQLAFFSCSINHCERRDVSNRICNGILQITAKYRQDNESIEDWTCQNCGTIINRR